MSLTSTENRTKLRALGENRAICAEECLRLILQRQMGAHFAANGGTFAGYHSFAESRLTSWRRKQSSANQSRLVVSPVSGKITGNSLDSGANPVSDSQI